MEFIASGDPFVGSNVFVLENRITNLVRYHAIASPPPYAKWTQRRAACAYCADARQSGKAGHSQADRKEGGPSVACAHA